MMVELYIFIALGIVTVLCIVGFFVMGIIEIHQENKANKIDEELKRAHIKYLSEKTKERSDVE